MGTLTKHFERVAYEHLGIRVTVEINYDRGTISLCEQNGGLKKWIFAGRSVEYMDGWQNILDAMKFAIEQARKELKKHNDAVEKQKILLVRKLQKEKF